jgi:hypothetical protein
MTPAAIPHKKGTNLKLPEHLYKGVLKISTYR